MRKYLILIVIIFFSVKGFNQTFIGKGGLIPDFDGIDKGYTYPLEVSGLPNKIDTNFGLETICLSINHTKVSDLKIELISPDGTSIWVSNRNGRDSGRDYIEACFNMLGFKGYIYEGKAPFRGTFVPDGRIQFLNNGQNPNGIWKLFIHDLAKGVDGELENWRLTFTTHPPTEGAKPCHLKNGSACKCPDGKSDCDLLPDLIVSYKMTDVLKQEYAWDDKTYPSTVRMAVGTGNIGWGPMETFGSNIWLCGKDTVTKGVKCKNGEAPRQILFQKIYHKSGDKVTFYNRIAGTNYFDSRPGHNHYHADRWVDFTFRKKDKKEKDPRKWKVLGRGTKASYCLFDSGNCTDSNQLCQDGKGNYGGFSTLANYGFGHYVDCESLIQGISVGGLDNYGISFEGQEIKLPKNIKNGNDYYLVIEIDPLNIYKETNEDNNFIVIPMPLKLQKR